MKKIGIVICIIVTLTITGCTIHIGDGSNGFKDIETIETRTETFVSEKEDTNELTLDLEMGIGELNIQGGSSKLLDASIDYNVEKWKPIFREKTSDADIGKNKKITIEQPQSKFVNTNPFSNNIIYDWDINLNNEIPVTLNADLGVSKSKIDMSKVNVKKLDIDAGVGAVNIDMTGDYDNKLDIDINGGVGKVKMDMTGDYKEKIDIDIESGVGNVEVNLDGNYENDVKIDLEGGVGSTEITLPKDIGVYVEVEKGLGGISIKSNKLKLVSSDNGTKIYKNDIYDSAEVKMNINMDVGVGSVLLK